MDDRIPFRSRLAFRLAIAMLCLTYLAAPAFGFAGETILVSVGLKSSNAGAASGIADPAVSANGRYVLIARRYSMVLLRDIWRGTYETIDQNAGGLSPHAITPDARYVTYAKDGRLYLRDRQAGFTELVSVGAAGNPVDISSFCSAITKDGRFVVFGSVAPGVAPTVERGLDLYVRDRLNRTTERLGTSGPFVLAYAEYSSRISISDDGRYVVFVATGPAPLDETNVFLYDRQARKIERISIAATGNAYASTSNNTSPTMTPDGRFVAFASDGKNFGTVDRYGRDIFLRDRLTGVVTRESYGPQPWVKAIAEHPSLSADGRFVAFHAWSWNLVTGDTNGVSDVFVRDRKTGTLERVSLATDGTQGTGPFGNSGSTDPSINRDGRWVVFASRSQHLVPNDFNIVTDAYLHDRGPVAP